MSLKELEAVVAKLPQFEFKDFAEWFERLRAERSQERSLDQMLAQITDNNLHPETSTGAEVGREKIAW